MSQATPGTPLRSADTGKSRATATILPMSDPENTIHAEPGSIHALILEQLDDDQAQEIVSIPLEGKS